MKLHKRDSDMLARRREERRELAAKFSTLAVKEKIEYIPSGFAITEFEIQAFLYLELLNRGFSVRGEVKTRCGTCCFDLVVYDGDTPVRIIEVKKNTKRKGSKTLRRAIQRKTELQLQKYRKFCVPVDLVSSMRAARDYVEKFEL